MPVALPTDAPWRSMVDVFEEVARRKSRSALSATSASGEFVHSTGAELTSLIARAASALHANGVESGQTVGIHLDNRAALEALVLHWAAQWLGAVAVPLGTRLAVPEVEYIVSHAEIALVCSGLDGRAHASRISDTTGAAVLDVSAGLRALVGPHAEAAAARLTENDVADILYTSGTTGRPKGAVLTHGNNVAAGLELMHASDLTADDVYQSAIPYFTSTGAHTNPLACLVAGAHLVVEPEFDQHRMLAMADAMGTTTYLGAPSMLNLVLRDADLSERPESLRHLVFGGSVMDAGTLRRLADAFSGCALTNLYGQTEAGPGGTVCKPAFILDKAGSIGNQGMGPWTSFALQRADGSTPDTGELGEIVLRSPAVMSGYHHDREQTASTIVDGWLHTGDLGFVDTDGFLFYADRLKDLVIRGGMNIASAEVESVLMTYPGIVDAAVIGVHHDVLGEDLLAVVVAPEGLDVDACLEHVRMQLADYKTPRRVVLVAELPRNAMGKVLKRDLREQFG